MPLPSIAEAVEPPAGWNFEKKSAEADNRYVLYSRPKQGSNYSAYRMEVHFSASPEDVLAAIRDNLDDPNAMPRFMKRKVLRREDSELISYDYIGVPFVTDRDVVTRTVIDRDEATGHHRVRWTAVTDEGPPPRNGVVRIPKSDGFWLLIPDGSGGTRGVYESHTELAGSLPASFVAANLPSSIVEQGTLVRRKLEVLRFAQR